MAHTDIKEAAALSGASFEFLGMQARIAHRMLALLDEGGPEKLASTLENLGDQLPRIRQDMDTAAAGLRWASDLCETARSLVEHDLEEGR